MLHAQSSWSFGTVLRWLRAAVPGEHGARLLPAAQVAVVRLGPHQHGEADHQGFFPLFATVRLKTGKKYVIKVIKLLHSILLVLFSSVLPVMLLVYLGGYPAGWQPFLLVLSSARQLLLLGWLLHAATLVLFSARIA